MAPSLWQNPVDPLDANGDGQVTALDALVVANALENLGSGSLAMLQTEAPVFYVDINGDGQLTSDDFDALVWYLDSQEPAAQPPEKEDAAKLPAGSDTSLGVGLAGQHITAGAWLTRDLPVAGLSAGLEDAQASAAGGVVEDRSDGGWVGLEARSVAGRSDAHAARIAARRTGWERVCRVRSSGRRIRER